MSMATPIERLTVFISYYGFTPVAFWLVDQFRFPNLDKLKIL